jgi:hypothetical protein
MRFTLAALAFLLPFKATAQSVDWKLYAGSRIQEGDISCFYDAVGVTRTSGRVRVWTKCLLEKELGNVYNDPIITDAAARKIADYYVPPLARGVQGIDLDTMIGYVVAEQIANVGKIEPSSRIFYEIDCSEKMFRELSITISHGHTDRPSDWKHIGPETNVTVLHNLVCQ